MVLLGGIYFWKGKINSNKWYKVVLKNGIWICDFMLDIVNILLFLLFL